MEEFKNTGPLAHYRNIELKSGILGYNDRTMVAFDGDDRDTSPTEMLKKAFTAEGFAYTEAAVLEHRVETLLLVLEIRAILINIVDESTCRANMSANMVQYLAHLINDLETENKR
jgi:hypothetical protein